MQAWHDLSETDRQWYRDNFDPQYKNGYTWFLFQCMTGASNSGPFTVAGVAPIGCAYIASQNPLGDPTTQDPAVEGSATVDYAIIGGPAVIR